MMLTLFLKDMIQDDNVLEDDEDKTRDYGSACLGGQQDWILTDSE